jgi:NADH:ubiquinone oxidoreductase subunit 6 (subunit J)
MSATQNLSYAVIQVVHNFGAVAVVGGSLIAWRVREKAARRKLGYLALAGWLTQAASGATFGMVTYHYHQQLPDIGDIATYALSIKMICATLGILMLAAYLWRSERWSEQGRSRVWLSSSALAITALSAAAFLRWFS